MEQRFIFVIYFFIVGILSLAFPFSYRENFLINKDGYLNSPEFDRKSDFIYKINKFNNIGQFNKTGEFNIQIFSSKKFFFLVDVKNLETLNNVRKIDFSNNFNLSTFYFSSFSNPNLDSYRFGIDLGTVYKLNKNVYIDFNTSFGLGSTGLGNFENTLQNPYSNSYGNLKLEINPKLKVYVKF